MTLEEYILFVLEKNSYIPLDCLNQLYALPLGQIPQKLYENSEVEEYCIAHNEMLEFRLALDRYINSDRTDFYLKRVEEALSQLPSPWGAEKGMQDKLLGTYLNPMSPDLIRQLYLLEDAALTKLLQKYCSTPPLQLFKDSKVPDAVQKKFDAIEATMKKIDSKKIESFIIKKQRRIRTKKRKQEELNRIAFRDEKYLKSHHIIAKDLVQRADTPYKPKCSAALSDRIRAAATQVAAFSTVKHITANKTLSNIFDQALYGRRVLMDLYLSFNPAALYFTDILNGDGNAVCLGPQDIDPKANGDIVIEFDVSKLIQSKPCAFFKQRDLEYEPDKIREVQFGKETLAFNHTTRTRLFDNTMSYFKIFESGSLKYTGSLPKSELISHNLEQMHEILTLNFFKFIDSLKDLNGQVAQSYIDNFYKKLNELNNKELVVFLKDIEKNMTDTAEFNFYGAHQINFSTITNISTRSKNYTLNLPKFIAQLTQGHIDALRQARIKIPELFESYRFLDYLLLQTPTLEVQYYLNDLRKQCRTPNWVEYNPLQIPEGFELCWELRSDPNLSEQNMELITGETIQKEPSNLEAPTREQFDTLKSFKTYREQFNVLIGELEKFSSYCGASPDTRVLGYQLFIQELKKEFAEAGQNFFSSVFTEEKEALKNSFKIFKTKCADLCQKSEMNFKHHLDVWSHIKLILKGFIGIILAISVTLLTLGIATYHLAKKETLRTKYTDTFFRLESVVIREAKNEWAQCKMQQKLFGNETVQDKGLIPEIEEAVIARI